jgi:hypothetical protein
MTSFVVVGRVYFLGLYGSQHLHREVVWPVEASTPREAVLTALPQHRSTIERCMQDGSSFQFPKKYRVRGRSFHCYVHVYTAQAWAAILGERAKQGTQPERVSFRERFRSDCE